MSLGPELEKGRSADEVGFRDCDLLRELFETVVRRCMAEGLVGGEGFAVDASLIVDRR